MDVPDGCMRYREGGVGVTVVGREGTSNINNKGVKEYIRQDITRT